MRTITVRMHHHYSNLPSEVAQGIWESFGWVDQSGPRPKKPGNAINGGQRVESSRTAIHQEVEEGSSSSDEEGDSPAATVDNMNGHGHSQANESCPADSSPSGPSTDIYHDRMRAHIKNLREFCDGLEYQLQFNDYRMLDVLEREGGSFLNLVEDCLRKEGQAPSSLIILSLCVYTSIYLSRSNTAYIFLRTSFEDSQNHAIPYKAFRFFIHYCSQILCDGPTFFFIPCQSSHASEATNGRKRNISVVQGYVVLCCCFSVVPFTFDRVQYQLSWIA